MSHFTRIRSVETKGGESALLAFYVDSTHSDTFQSVVPELGDDDCTCSNCDRLFGKEETAFWLWNHEHENEVAIICEDCAESLHLSPLSNLSPEQPEQKDDE